MTDKEIKDFIDEKIVLNISDNKSIREAFVRLTQTIEDNNNKLSRIARMIDETFDYKPLVVSSEFSQGWNKGWKDAAAQISEMYNKIINQ